MKEINRLIFFVHFLAFDFSCSAPNGAKFVIYPVKYLDISQTNWYKHSRAIAMTPDFTSSVTVRLTFLFLGKCLDNYWIILYKSLGDPLRHHHLFRIICEDAEVVGDPFVNSRQIRKALLRFS